MAAKVYWLVRLSYAVAVLTLSSLAPTAARADFFDDARRTVTTDIPHFFQDDVPCAFGGHPTSRTKTSCKSAAKSTGHAAKHADDKEIPPGKGSASGDAPPNSGR